MNDQKILEMLMVSAAQAMERFGGNDDISKGRVACEFLNGVLQSTSFLMRFDGEVSPHRLNKIVVAGMKSIGLTIGTSGGQHLIPKSPPAN